MLMSNWCMINTFVSNLGTAPVILFIICKLTYCIKFTKFLKFIFLSLTSRFLYSLFLNNVVVLVAYVIAVTPIVWVSRRYLDIYSNYEITPFFCSEINLFLFLFLYAQTIMCSLNPRLPKMWATRVLNLC